MFRLLTRSVTYVAPSISISSLFGDLTDCIGCLYIVHSYIVAQSNPEMVMALLVSLRRWFGIFVPHLNTRIDLVIAYIFKPWAVYERDWIRPWFASNVSEGQYSTKCPIPPQSRQVYRIGAASVRNKAGDSVPRLAAYGFGSWVLNSAIFLFILSTFFVFFVFLINQSVGFRNASSSCLSAVAQELGILLFNF